MTFLKYLSNLFGLEKKEKDEAYYSKCIRSRRFQKKVVSKELRDNESFAFAAVKYNNILFKYVSERLRNNKKLAKIAVKSFYLLLNYASEDLRDDEEVVLIAIKNYKNHYPRYDCDDDNDYDRSCAKSFLYASKRLQNDVKFLKTAIRVNKKVLDHVHLKFKDNEEFMIAVGIQGIHMFKKHASKRLLNDKNTVLAISEHNENILEYAPKKLCSDKEFILKVVRLNGYGIFYASNRLIQDRDVALAAVKQDGRVLEDLPSHYQDNREICIAAIRQNPDAYKYSAAIRWDELESIKNNIN